MAKTVERDPQTAPTPKDLARQLRHVRRKQGLSRTEVARSAGLTRRELAAYERGRVDIPESDLWCLAGSCGVDVGELLPHRENLRVDSNLSSLAIGDAIRHLRSPDEPDALLREYLSMIYELRNLPPGSRVPLRDEDLRSLADALGGAPDVIEARLGELIGANREEAARLRAMILPPLSLPAPGLDAPPPPDFFATPRAEDPFAPPPAPVETAAPVASASPLDPAPLDPTPLDAMPPAASTPEPDPDPDPLATLPVDPFALAPDLLPADMPEPLAGLRADPFAAPGSEPSGPASIDPDAAADGIVVDLGEPQPAFGHSVGTEPSEPLVAPHTVLDVPGTPRVDPPADEAPLDDPSGADEAPLDPARVEDAPSDTIALSDGPVDEDLPEPVAPIAWHAPVVAITVDATEPAPNGNGPSPHFTRAGPDWQVGGMSPAAAMADDGALALRRADARWALCDVHQPGDFSVETVLDFTAGAGFGILFRANVDALDRVSGYSFDVDAVAGGGGYLLRQWEANRPHWRPLAQAQVTDPSMLFGRHTISLTMRGDQLTVHVDGETIVTVSSLSRLSVELGHEPCRGDRLGVQAGATTEVTVDRFAAAPH